MNKSIKKIVKPENASDVMVFSPVQFYHKEEGFHRKGVESGTVTGTTFKN